MKLGIYAICKNEEGNVQRWLDALLPELRPTDSLTVVDTGSEDETVSVFKRNGIIPHTVVIKPWRFDAARNVALHLSDPTADAVWSLDLDEFPQPGWRKGVGESWVGGDMTRLRYNFIWNFKENGDPDIVFYADKLHKRHGFTWKGIAHEWLSYEGVEKHVWTEDVTIHHLQDHSKERFGRDLELMERAIAETPEDQRLQHYYARQLLWAGKLPEAVDWFKKHLDNKHATWRHERSESMLYLAQCGGNDAWIDMWLLRAAAECPERREVWWALHDREMQRGNLDLARGYRMRAESLPRDKFYLSKSR